MFWKKKPSEVNTKTETKSEIDSFKKEYLDLKSDISYMRSQWDTYIQKSLEDDLPFYQTFAESTGVDDNSENKFWTMTEFKSDGFTLIKKGDHRWKSLRIRCRSSFDDSNGKMSIYGVTCEGKNLDSKGIISILTKYFYIMKINNKKRDSNHERKAFEEMTQIVGKDTIRDARIDNILKDL